MGGHAPIYWWGIEAQRPEVVCPRSLEPQVQGIGSYESAELQGSPRSTRWEPSFHRWEKQSARGWAGSGSWEPSCQRTNSWKPPDPLVRPPPPHTLARPAHPQVVTLIPITGQESRQLPQEKRSRKQAPGAQPACGLGVPLCEMGKLRSTPGEGAVDGEVPAAALTCSERRLHAETRRPRVPAPPLTHAAVVNSRPQAGRAHPAGRFRPPHVTPRRGEGREGAGTRPLLRPA